MATKQTTRSLRQDSGGVQGPQYQVLSDSFLDNKFVKAGDTVVYFGLPGSQLKPVNAEAKERKIKVRDIRVNTKLDAEAKAEAFKALSDEWNGVEAPDQFAAGEADLDEADLPPVKAK